VPPRPRRVSRGMSSRGARRRVTWAQFATTGVGLGTSGHSTNIDLLGQYRTAGGVVDGSTIVRVHITLAITSAVVANENFTWGLMTVGFNEVAATFVTGTGPVDPIDTPYEDWMLLRHETAVPTYGRQAANQRLEHDLRSKRKIEDLGRTLILSVSTQTSAAALTADVFARTLLALP